jgi:Epoxide hydrolase N terminus
MRSGPPLGLMRTEELDDIGIHFIRERGKGPNPFPISLTHGYPDSFYRFAKIIPTLTNPESFGGRAEDAFDVVVPDPPGYTVFLTDLGRWEWCFGSTTSWFPLKSYFSVSFTYYFRRR